MATSTLTSKGQITLPKTVRERLQVDTGDQVEFIFGPDDEIVVRGISVHVTNLKGLLKREGRKPVTIEEMNAAIERNHARKQ
jgi:AbrB family looped-hinge helix DNA binding protein